MQRKRHRRSTRIISEHFRRDGTPKTPYKSQQRARGELRRRKLQNDGQHEYKCGFCGQWHFGH